MCKENEKISRYKDYSGMKLGCLTVVGKESKGKRTQWKCLCECGNEKFMEATVLKRGGFKDCRCKEKSKTRIYKNKCYKVWHMAKYKDVLSEEFKDFHIFKNYIENELSPPKCDYFICRIDRLKLFERNNIALRIGRHITNICGIDYKFCMKCQRYIQNLGHMFYKSKNACANCNLKDKLKRKFKLEYKEYLELIKRCERKCEICKKDLKFMGKYKTAVIDHCHTTGKTRGILCRQCNNALGLFYDNVDTIKKAILYLEKGDTNHVYQKKDNPIINTICEITGNKDNLVCDHNHKTGLIRGNIYNYTNLAIGLMKDSIENLENSIEYLERNQNE